MVPLLGEAASIAASGEDGETTLTISSASGWYGTCILTTSPLVITVCCSLVEPSVVWVRRRREEEEVEELTSWELVLWNKQRVTYRLLY